MSRGHDTGEAPNLLAGSVSWSSLDDLAADIAARWNSLLDILDHYEIDVLPKGHIKGWRDLAACAGTYHPAFFPEDRRVYPGKRSLKQAQEWCDTCGVQTECLEYAIRHDIRSGVWGGKTYHQRRGK